MAYGQWTLFDLGDAEDAVRRRWRELVDIRLPAAAKRRDWPIHANHCFARVLLDVTVGRPWREVVAVPAWRNAPVDVLVRAHELGEAVLAGKADLAMFDERSLQMRGKPPKKRAHPA